MKNDTFRVDKCPQHFICTDFPSLSTTRIFQVCEGIVPIKKKKNKNKTQPNYDFVACVTENIPSSGWRGLESEDILAVFK